MRERTTYCLQCYANGILICDFVRYVNTRKMGYFSFNNDFSELKNMIHFGVVY